MPAVATLSQRVTIDSRTGAITRTDAHYALAHANRFVHPGAHRIASNETGRDLDNVAFHNRDDGSVVLLVPPSAKQARTFTGGQRAKRFADTWPPRSLATFVRESAAAQHD